MILNPSPDNQLIVTPIGGQAPYEPDAFILFGQRLQLLLRVGSRVVGIDGKCSSRYVIALLVVPVDRQQDSIIVQEEIIIAGSMLDVLDQCPDIVLGIIGVVVEVAEGNDGSAEHYCKPRKGGHEQRAARQAE